MALRKPPVKKVPSGDDLDSFLAGAGDRQKPSEKPHAASKKKTSSKKTTKKKSVKGFAVVPEGDEKESYKYNFLIFPSYVKKIAELKAAGINVQPRMRKLVYPLIDRLLEDLDDE